jgi:hypothetical protein
MVKKKLFSGGPGVNDLLGEAVPVVDVFRSFRLEPGLGDSVSVALLVKYQKEKKVLVEHRKQFIEAHKKNRFGSLLLPLREKKWPGGFAAILDLASNLNPDQGRWQIDGEEVRGLAFQNGMVAIAFVNTVGLYDIKDGGLIRLIKNPKFKNLHSVAFSPVAPNLILVSNSGMDNILELEWDSGRIVWSWDAWAFGYGINPFGINLLSGVDEFPAGARDLLLSHTEVLQRISKEQTAKDERWFVHIDRGLVEHPLGLEKWMKGAEPNWAGYHDSSGDILATLFVANQAVRIDRKTGQVRVLCDGLSRPHGMIAFERGFLISDTRKGMVLELDSKFELRNKYDFSNMPCHNAMAVDDGEWLQFTSPIGDGSLLATVDSRRSVVFVWNLDLKVYAIYPFPDSWSVHGVLGLSSP